MRVGGSSMTPHPRWADSYRTGLLQRLDDVTKQTEWLWRSARSTAVRSAAAMPGGEPCDRLESETALICRSCAALTGNKDAFRIDEIQPRSRLKPRESAQQSGGVGFEPTSCLATANGFRDRRLNGLLGVPGMELMKEALGKGIESRDYVESIRRTAWRTGRRRPASERRGSCRPHHEGGRVVGWRCRAW